MRLHALRLLLLLAISLPLALHAQTKARRFSLAVTPAFEFSSLANRPINAPLKSHAFGAGLQVSPTWHLGRHFSLQTGLGINRYHYSSQLTGVWNQQYDTFGDQDPHYGHTVQFQLAFSLLQVHVPLMVRYHFQSQSKGFFVGLGPELSAIQIWNLASQILDQGVVFDDDALKRSTILPMIAGRVGIGYQHPLGDRLCLVLECYGKVATSLLDYARFPAYTAGLQAGIAF
jgi:Outer membrane protein beta-barrel domain